MSLIEESIVGGISEIIKEDYDDEKYEDEDFEIEDEFEGNCDKINNNNNNNNKTDSAFLISELSKIIKQNCDSIK